MSLLQLPTELQLAIAELLEPRVIPSLASTCHHFHNVLKDKLALYQHYNPANAAKLALSLQQIIREIAAKPQLGRYVERLHFKDYMHMNHWESEIEIDKVLALYHRLQSSNRIPRYFNYSWE